jgi:hypothetical protein
MFDSRQRRNGRLRKAFLGRDHGSAAVILVFTVKIWIIPLNASAIFSYVTIKTHEKNPSPNADRRLARR